MPFLQLVFLMVLHLVINENNNSAEHHQKVHNFTTKPAGFWNHDKGQKKREALEKAAKNMGFDPLVVENWYSMVRREVLENNKVITKSYRIVSKLFYF